MKVMSLKLSVVLINKIICMMFHEMNENKISTKWYKDIMSYLIAAAVTHVFDSSNEWEKFNDKLDKDYENFEKILSEDTDLNNKMYEA